MNKHRLHLQPLFAFLHDSQIGDDILQSMSMIVLKGTHWKFLTSDTAILQRHSKIDKEITEILSEDQQTVKLVESAMELLDFKQGEYA